MGHHWLEEHDQEGQEQIIIQLREMNATLTSISLDLHALSTQLSVDFEKRENAEDFRFISLLRNTKKGLIEILLFLIFFVLLFPHLGKQ